jgi:O-antigen ligase
MLLIFPFAYLLSFFLSLRGLWQKKTNAIFIYVIAGLPIYNTALSIVYGYKLKSWIPVLQSCKELLIVVALVVAIWNYRKKLIPHRLDYWILAFLAYTVLYVLLPIGKYDLLQKLVALKSLSFFTIIYFVGRLLDTSDFSLQKILYAVGVLAFFAACLLAFEVVTYTHFQTHIGYAFFNQDYYGLDVGGHYGLSWSFEINDGLKRFASFFANPLELAGSTLVATSLWLAVYTTSNNKLEITKTGWIIAGLTLFALLTALSRSSLAGYFILLYAYALITRKKEILYFIYALVGIGVVYLFYVLNDRNVYEYIISTVQLSDSSSIGHLLEWVEGIQSIVTSPLGLGLGESGRVAAAVQENVGGENQFIIVGVQTGIISLLLYLGIYVVVVSACYRAYKLYEGNTKKMALALFVLKLSFIFPLMTSNFDSYSYILYLTWLLTGIFITSVGSQTLNTAHETSGSRNTRAAQ